MAATHTFSSEPRAINTRRPKYRDPKDDSAEVQKFQQCIQFDKRVHRGNTYSTHTQQAHRDATDAAKQATSPPTMRRASTKRKEISPFDMELPRPERNVVNLLPHLVEDVKIVEEDTAEAQTDEFLPEAPAPEYLPQKTGIDAYTQVEDGELFNFDVEVDPLLDVLVNKTLEQSLMEVEEEHEVLAMQNFKAEWYRKQSLDMQDWQDQVKMEKERCEAKEEVVRERRERRRREREVLLKLQAVSATEAYTPKLVPNAINDLLGVCFPDAKELAIEQLFMPSLIGQVRLEQERSRQAEMWMDGIADARVERLLTSQRTAADSQKARWDEIQRQHAEEEQIRLGNIQIYVNDGAGGTVSVGPVQIPTEETGKADLLGDVNKAIFSWLLENEPDLATQMPYGIILCLEDKPVVKIEDVLSAKSGQLSMIPADPPPEEEEVEEPQGGEGGDDEAHEGDGEEHEPA